MIEPAGSATNLNLPEEAHRPFYAQTTHEPSGDRCGFSHCCTCLPSVSVQPIHSQQLLYMLAKCERTADSQTTSDLQESSELASKD